MSVTPVVQLHERKEIEQFPQNRSHFWLNCSNAVRDGDTMIHPTSRAIAGIPNLDAFLREEGEAFVGWGYKPSGKRARVTAKRKGMNSLLLEDGFLRSVERQDPPLSLVVDDLGIYYDAARPSRLEKTIPEKLMQAQRERARSLIQAWRSARVSKYNHTREYEGNLPECYVLVIDQTYGDASISHGQADETNFRRMVEAALAENPDCTIIIKTHPDVIGRKKRGYFEPNAGVLNPRIRLIHENCHPVRLIEKAQAVYTVTSQVGFEALIWGIPVRCFGMPFYAGWGLTADELPAPERRCQACLEQLVHAALITYPRYVDPETGERCEAERIIEYIAFQMAMRLRFPRRIYAIGFSRWKKPILRKFFAGSEVRFVRRSGAVPAGATLAVWGNRTPEGLARDVTFIRVEDGFLRSVGLGADLIKPLSWVQDASGIYYDSSRPSALERILQETDFSEATIARARVLRERIVKAGITKYNHISVPWKRPAGSSLVVLVPGQVEEDASVRYGARDIKTNVELLRAVRRSRPNAYIVYKPHPDIVAGLRPAGKDEDEISAWCDEIAGDADIAAMLDQIDEVHVLTSLAGFEALLRGVSVICHGQPFYAGWGQTEDMIALPRRTRRLTMDEFVAGSLILYPTYVSRTTGCFTPPERAVEELIAWKNTGITSIGLPRRIWRLVMRMSRIFRQ